MTQEQLDRMTFEMFVDCNLNAAETARQMGIARSTVKARTRRESLRRSADHRPRTYQSDALGAVTIPEE